MKPSGQYKPLNKIPSKVISGNLRKSPVMRSLTMQVTENLLQRVDKEAEELEVPRNRFINMVLDHYWSCKKK